MSDKDKLPDGADPDATISGPLRPAPGSADGAGSAAPAPPDPDVTPTRSHVKDPDQTITTRDASLADLRREMQAANGEKSAEQPAEKPAAAEPDPEATFSGPFKFDADATISTPPGSRRRNPFAPKALPEALQANLAALGGLNPLLAFANPILSAVPQISAVREHPDPARLKETLQDLIEAFEAGASKAGVPGEVLAGAAYALCCMVDDAAASTPWGKDWARRGLLKELRDEDNGGEEFFALLKASEQKPEENADLLEFMYICLALGFQGRYRDAKDPVAAGAELAALRSGLHALISRRRGRPAGGLSQRWRPAGPNVLWPASPGARSSAERSIPWTKILAPVFALLVLVLGYKVFKPAEIAPEPVLTPAPAVVAEAPKAPPVAETPAPAAQTPAPASVAQASPVPVPAPVPSSTALTPRQVLENDLAAELKGGLVSFAADGDRIAIDLRDERQFASGTIEPAAAVKALVTRIAEVLERVPGPVLVRGYADSAPTKPGAGASNQELSAARAQAVAALIAAKLTDPKRVTSEGLGDADPIAPNDSPENRARNRRVRILVASPK